MKSLWIGLLPVILFWIFEEKFGTFWGLVVAMVWAIGELAWGYIKNRAIDKFTLFSSALVLVLGTTSLIMDNSLFFKLQPSVVEILFAGLIFWQNKRDRTWLFGFAKKANPEIFNNLTAEQAEARLQAMLKLVQSLILFLVIHGLMMLVIALKGTTGQWAFMKGIGFYILFAAWFAVEFLRMKRKNKKPLS